MKSIPTALVIKLLVVCDRRFFNPLDIFKVSHYGFFNWTVDSCHLLLAAIGHPAEAGRPDLNVDSMRD
jgi:hypothetical protein